MKKNRWLTALVGLCFLAPHTDARKLPYRDKNLSVAERVADLQPGETKEVRFTLPKKAFMVYNNHMNHVLEPGTFRILTGPNSAELQETRIEFR